MDAEIARYRREYPNLDALMVETILNMTEEQHKQFQARVASGEREQAPDKLILEDAIKVINCDKADD
jgi:DNA-binding transcriptional regulator YbjK